MGNWFLVFLLLGRSGVSSNRQSKKGSDIEWVEKNDIGIRIIFTILFAEGTGAMRCSLAMMIIGYFCTSSSKRPQKPLSNLLLIAYWQITSTSSYDHKTSPSPRWCHLSTNDMPIISGTRYNVTGHLFEERFFDRMIASTYGMLKVSSYIHLNPVEAGMASAPEKYPWSSYPSYISKPAKSDVQLNTNAILDIFPGNEMEKKRRYQEFLADENNVDHLVREWQLKWFQLRWWVYES